MKEIKLLVGTDLKTAIDELLAYKAKGESVCATFNGYTFMSDDITLDKAFLQIQGKTYAESLASHEKWRKEYDDHKAEVEKAIPAKVVRWNEAGKGLVADDKYELWMKIVPIRAADLYEGMEIDACLAILRKLEESENIQDAINVLESQDHSGMSHSLVVSMVTEFAKRGQEFYDTIKAQEEAKRKQWEADKKQRLAIEAKEDQDE